VAVDKAKILKDAQKFISKGQVDKAIAEYEKLVKSLPNDTNAHNSIGDLYLKKGKGDKAVEHFSKAAELLNKDGFTLKAIALYKKVLNINPEQVDVLMVMGRLNAERGMVGNANDNYLAAAAYFSKTGKRERVLDVYKTLCNLNPDNLHMQQKLAELFQAEGMENEAVAKFISLAEKKVESGELTDARQVLKNALGKGSERSDYMRVSAMIDIEEGRMSEALEKLGAARDSNPDNIKVLTLLGDLYMRTGEYEQAIDALKAILDKEPENTGIQKKLIEISLKNGDFESAWDGYRGLVEGHIEKMEHDKAEKLLNEYIGHDPKRIEARHMLSDLYGSIGRDDKVTDLQLAIAGLYAEKGEADKARNICNTLKEKQPDNKAIDEAIASIENPPAQAPEPVEEAVSEPAPASEEPEEEEPVREEVELSLEEPFEGMEDMPVQDEIPSDGGAESPFGGFEEEEEEDVSGGFEIEEPSGGGIDEAAEEMQPEEPQEEERQPEEEIGGFGIESADDLSGEHGFDEPFGEEDGGFGEEGLEEPFGQLETTGFDYDESAPENEPDSEFIADTPFSTYDEPAPDVSLKEEEPVLEEQPAQETEPATGAETDTSSPEMQLGGFEPAFEEEAVSEKVYDLGEAAEDVSSPDLQDMAEAVSQQPSPVASLEPAEEPAGFEERLTEVDVYIKYGLFPKAKETLDSLSSTHANNPEIARRKLEISKAEGDTNAYASHALELGGIYYSKGMEEEALEVLSSANRLCPDDERIKRKLDALQASAGPVSVSAEPPEMEEGTAVLEEETSFAEIELDEAVPAGQPEEEVSFAGVSEEETSFAGLDVEAEEEEDETLADTMSEADFYAQQGLRDEALGIYRRILASNPEYEEARRRYDVLMAEKAAMAEAPEEPEVVVVKEAAEPVEKAELDAAFTEFEDSGVPEAEVAEAEVALEPEPVEAELEDVSDGDDFFDLAAELRDDMEVEIAKPVGDSTEKESVFGDAGLDSAFQEFKKGIEEQIGSEDYETHYNLGIAYKEMGMLDDALAEFNEASRDPSRGLDCASMLGLCHIEKGEYATAIEHFKKGLRVAGRTREEYLGIKYDMATAFELKGDVASAQSLVSDVYNEDRSFRDVKKRLQRLNKKVVEAGGVPDGEAVPEEPAKEQPKAAGKKNKVSYL